MSDEYESTASAETKLPAKDRRIVRGLRAVVLLHRGFEQGAREVGVSIPQYRLLLFLQHGPRRAGELAASAAVKRPTLTALVAGMEKARWIRRVDVEGDRRGVSLELTPKGRGTIEAIEGKLCEILDEICSAGEREAMLNHFDVIADILHVQVEDRIRRYRGR